MQIRITRGNRRGLLEERQIGHSQIRFIHGDRKGLLEERQKVIRGDRKGLLAWRKGKKVIRIIA